MNAQEVFDRFIAAANAKLVPKPGWAESTVRVYGSIWECFVRHLAKDGRSWQDADAATAIQYCQTGAKPRSKTKGAASSVSDQSKRQIWYVLNEIYLFASALGWVAENPFAAIHHEEVPKVKKFESALLLPKQWDGLHRYVLDLDETHPGQLRTKALAMLAMECALTAQELCSLHSAYVTFTEDGMRIEIPQIARVNQKRTVVAGVQTARVVKAYREQRLQIACAPGVSEQDRYNLFLSNQRRPLSPRMAFHTVRELILKACQKEDIPLPARMGPQLLRNSAIWRWIEVDRVPIEKVCVAAGYKDARALRWILYAIHDESVKAAIAKALREGKAPYLDRGATDGAQMPLS